MFISFSYLLFVRLFSSTLLEFYYAVSTTLSTGPSTGTAVVWIAITRPLSAILPIPSRPRTFSPEQSFTGSN
ncbi:hypothetical protein QR685DRAFT_532633 [Neurospora intermedia]|uniref:Secreted protein n=1 Tax=Neurospora intermedia TaxID=5142 RepID=A0ABR3D700_NEUIN